VIGLLFGIGMSTYSLWKILSAGVLKFFSGLPSSLLSPIEGFDLVGFLGLEVFFSSFASRLLRAETMFMQRLILLSR
jgi:hypothetical protein